MFITSCAQFAIRLPGECTLLPHEAAAWFAVSRTLTSRGGGQAVRGPPAVGRRLTASTSPASSSRLSTAWTCARSGTYSITSSLKAMG